MSLVPKFLRKLGGNEAQRETVQSDQTDRLAGRQDSTPSAAPSTAPSTASSGGRGCAGLPLESGATPAARLTGEVGERDERSYFFRRPERDAPFNQHDFRPRAEFLRSPKAPVILISERAYRRMCLIVELAPQEVGWLGTVERMPSGNFYIDEIFVPEQDVTGTETDPTDEGQFRVMNELAEMGEEGMQKIEKLRFWGHSHVRMMTSPSGTDENTPLNYQRLGLPWFIRGIFNKLGRAEFTVYLFDEGYRFCDVPWRAVDSQTGETLGTERLRLAQGYLGDRENEALPTVKLHPKLVPGEVERKQVEKELAGKLKPRSFGGLFSGWARDATRDFGDDNRGTIGGGSRRAPVSVQRDVSSPPERKEY